MISKFILACYLFVRLHGKTGRKGFSDFQFHCPKIHEQILDPSVDYVDFQRIVGKIDVFWVAYFLQLEIHDLILGLSYVSHYRHMIPHDVGSPMLCLYPVHHCLSQK